MANMSYCRFENTFKDLYDCYQAVLNMDGESYEELSDGERSYLESLRELCGRFQEETEWLAKLSRETA
jgi:hypothetical protein